MWCIANFTDPTSGAVSWQVRLTEAPDQIVAGGFVHRHQAVTHLGVLLAAALVAAPSNAPQGRRFRATFEEGEATRDGGGYTRVIDPGATNFDRAMPLPLMATCETTWGHEGARLAGAITSASRDGASTIVLEGRWDVCPEAVEFARLVDDGMLTRHSPDLGSDETEFECTTYDEMYGWCEEGVLHFVDATLLGTTVLPFPALDGAAIENVDEAAVEDVPAMAAAGARPPRTVLPTPAALVAAPMAVRVEPPFPAAAFDDPQLAGPRPFTVDPATGWGSGHVALFDSCHIGFPDQCLTAPRSATGYAHAHTSAPVELDNGTTLRVGHITVGTGHAPTHGVSSQAAAGHYDDSGYSAALVRFGEDEHGIWAAGVVDPNATDEQVWALRVSATSGDWRRIDGNLELVAVLAVNVPGFPVPETVAASAAGECVALVAAGARGMVRLGRSRPRPVPPATLVAQIAAEDALRASVISRLEHIGAMLDIFARPGRLAAVEARMAASRPARLAVPKRRVVRLDRTRALPSVADTKLTADTLVQARASLDKFDEGIREAFGQRR